MMRLTRLYFRAVRQQLKTSLAQNRQLVVFILLLGPVAVVLPLGVLAIIFSDQYDPGLRLGCFALLLFVLHALLQKLESAAHFGVDIAYLDYLAPGARRFSLLLLLWCVSLPVIEVVSLSWGMVKAETPVLLLLLSGYLLVISAAIIYYPALSVFVNVLAIVIFYTQLPAYDLWLFGWMCVLVALLFLPLGIHSFFFLKMYAQNIRGVLAGSAFLLGLYALITRVYGYHAAEVWPVMLVSLLLMNLYLLASRRFVADHKAFGCFVDYLALKKGFLVWQGFSVLAGLFMLAVAVLIWIQPWLLSRSLLFFAFYVLLFGIGLLLLRRDNRDVFLVCNLPGFAALLWQMLI